MDLYRFYLPGLREVVQGDRGLARLPEEEAHHAQTVLRLGAKGGSPPVIVFDGEGGWAKGNLVMKGRKEVWVETSELHIDPPPGLRLTVATAVPKGERADWLVEQASQLDVARLQWLDCERGVVKPRDDGGKMEKWRRLAVESAKQCGRTHLLAVQAPAPLGGLLTASWRKVLWLDPREKALTLSEAMRDITSGEILALIGPEGGWSVSEQKSLEAAAARGGYFSDETWADGAAD